MRFFVGSFGVSVPAPGNLRTQTFSKMPDIDASLFHEEFGTRGATQAFDGKEEEDDDNTDDDD